MKFPATVAFMIISTWASASHLQAQLLLTVDTSDPSAITFTATTENPSSSTGSSYSLFAGITLGNFFTGPLTDRTALALSAGSDLRPFGVGEAYDNVITAPVTSTTEDLYDLNLYSISATSQNFDSSTQALTGTAILSLDPPTSPFDPTTPPLDPETLAAYIALLPSDGTTGVLYAGNYYYSGYHQAIGTWEVVNSRPQAVPEPAAGVLATIILAVLIFCRRRQATMVRAA